jgi:S-(hydroxymethyl)glutathione dehydrogenase/alcohol dehydrogenase
LFFERKLLGCTGGSNIPARDIPRIAALYREGSLDLSTLVTRQRPLSEFAEAVADAERGEVARTVLLPG